MQFLEECDELATMEKHRKSLYTVPVKSAFQVVLRTFRIWTSNETD